MADLPSRTDYLAIGAQYVASRATRIDPRMVYVQGSDVNIIVGVASVLASAVTRQLGYSAGRLLLDGCTTDEDLDRLAWDRYQTTRKGASPSQTVQRLYRQSSANGAGTVPVGERLRTIGGGDWITTSPGTFGATTLDGVLVNARSVQAGKATQVGANTVRRFANPADLFDPTLQVNNDAPSGGGEDRESFDDFKNRLRNFWLTARRGTLAAIEAGALSVPGVVSANAVEVLTPTALPARIVLLYIADSSGLASVPMAAQVVQQLLDYRAAGITVLVQLGVPFMQAVQLLLAFQTGVDTVAMSYAVRAAVVEFINSLPVNGTLYLADLYSVLRRFVAQGLIQNQSSIVSPVADVVPTAGQDIRTTLTLVTSN